MSTLESEPWALFTYHYLEVVAHVQGIVHPGLTLPILVGQSMTIFVDEQPHFDWFYTTRV